MSTAKTVGRNSRPQMFRFPCYTSGSWRKWQGFLHGNGGYYMARRIHPRLHFCAAEKSANLNPHFLPFQCVSVTPMLSTTGPQQHSSIWLLLIVLKMYCYCSSCPVWNFTGLRCKLVSPLRRFRSHVYCESDHASVTENGSLHWRHQNSSVCHSDAELLKWIDRSEPSQAIAEIIGKWLLFG